MSDEETTPEASGDGSQVPADTAMADIAYRRAWRSLLLYPLAFVASFVIGEGLISLLHVGEGDPASWVLFVAATPALVVFAAPGILAVVQGRKAMRLGRPDGNLPASIGGMIAVGFVGLNFVSYLLQVLFG